MSEGPRYLYDMDRLIDALSSLRMLLDQLDVEVEIAFAVKAAPLVPVVATLCAAGANVELMHESETAVARASQVDPLRWVVQAPLCGPEQLRSLQRSGATVVVHDDGQARDRSELAETGHRSGGLLLRGCDPEGTLSARHGVMMDSPSWRDAAITLQRARETVNRAGLHFHGRNSLTGSGVGALRARVAASWSVLAEVWDGIDVLDIGGGLPAPSSTSWEPGRWLDSVATLIDALDPAPETLIIEPGTALVAGAGSLILPVAAAPRRADVRLPVTGSPARLLPEARDAWEPGSFAPLRASTDARPAPEAKAQPTARLLVGPTCMGSDALQVPDLGNLSADDRRPPAPSVVIDGAGAYHHALASGLLAGGGGQAAVGFRGVAGSRSEAAHQLTTTGWVVLSTASNQTLEIGLAALLDRLGLEVDARQVGQCAQGYDTDAEIWATFPHTDGSRDAEPPEFVALRLIERDNCDGGTDSLVRVDDVLAELERRHAFDVIDLLTDRRVPMEIRGCETRAESLVKMGSAGWEARWFRPSIRWTGLTNEATQDLTDAMAWVDRIAEQSAQRVDLLMESGQTLIFDNRRLLHWRTLIHPDSKRRWERRYLIDPARR